MATPLQPISPVAEVICETRERFAQRLPGRMRSERTAIGPRGPEQVIKLWTGANDNWTLAVSDASGTSCIIAMGEEWQVLDRNPA